MKKHILLIVVILIASTGASDIGNGAGTADSSEQIFIATRCIVKAGNSENPTDVIENDGSTDLANKLNGKH